MNHPHFDIQAGTQPSPAAERAAGALLVRTADCLTALLQGPTATAGLNESRYNVLDTLRRMPGGTSTQTDLAARLLQSESNLSTLLERMRHDELISRIRSETDRRKSLIGLTNAGRETLAKADLARSRATAALFKAVDDSQQAALCAALGFLLQHFEGELGVAAAMTSARQPHRAFSPATDGLTT